MGLFRRKRESAPTRVKETSDLKKIGTPIRAIVTDVLRKRNGYIVVALYEDRWLGTQYSYTSELLTEAPCVTIGGEVVVYVNDLNMSGNYWVEC